MAASWHGSERTRAISTRRFHPTAVNAGRRPYPLLNFRPMNRRCPSNAILQVAIWSLFGATLIRVGASSRRLKVGLAHRLSSLAVRTMASLGTTTEFLKACPTMATATSPCCSLKAAFSWPTAAAAAKKVPSCKI